MNTIAAKFGLTTDQIRWSNGLKTTDISEGNTLYLPSTPGIVYTVKSGDTIESIAGTYGSSVAEITALNDLEVSGISEGMRIVIKDGTLPQKERPEYVAPIVVARTTTYTYSYLGNSYERENIREIARGFYTNSPGNPSVAGQCTWYAWWWRATSPLSLGPLPGGPIGNANAWDTSLSSSFRVDHTPEVGAVFQTDSGWYGHVGVVVGMNQDGSITVREMNMGIPYRVTEAEIPASMIGRFKYIH